jgi:hypothetical protein
LWGSPGEVSLGVMDSINLSDPQDIQSHTVPLYQAQGKAQAVSDASGASPERAEGLINHYLHQHFPDQADVFEYMPLWDAANYKTSTWACQPSPDPLDRPTFVGVTASLTGYKIPKLPVDPQATPKLLLRGVLRCAPTPSSRPYLQLSPPLPLGEGSGVRANP